ncbi:MAG TPA: S-methyl-5-thioribose-1-phosphate isomerase [Burkholderiales bacterium]|nr:S-methyl-5-thioribose-1-phosphate isomerase [Burkholderiales bacterium]
MQVDGVAYRSIWRDGDVVRIIDQTLLPHTFRVVKLGSAEEVADAIRNMRVRGAPLIGAAAAFGMAMAMAADASGANLTRAGEQLAKTRPTAINLRWAIGRMAHALRPLAVQDRPEAAWKEAQAIADEDVAMNHAIGQHGVELIRKAAENRSGPVNVLTHCNAGWLATVDMGTALAPIYLAHDQGIPVHVWVDETRPRNQGLLTAWELAHHGVPHTVIADNAGGHLMQRGQVDISIVGADRVTARGDVCNKIGTYLKALAAKDCGIPFCVAFPGSTIDWDIEDGFVGIPIEERGADELRSVAGRGGDGEPARLWLVPERSPVANPAFDVTPAALVSMLITERGLAPASRAGLSALYPERSQR